MYKILFPDPSFCRGGVVLARLSPREEKQCNYDRQRSSTVGSDRTLVACEGRGSKGGGGESIREVEKRRKQA